MITRRTFLHGAAGLACAGLGGPAPARADAEPPPETTTIRLVQIPSVCLAPQYVAGDLLRAEGFIDIRYVRRAAGPTGVYRTVASGDADLSMAFVAPFLIEVDAGAPIVLLAGVHPGCFELFGGERVRAIRDLKGKTVSVPALNGGNHVFVSSMAAYVGLDPRSDITWVIHPSAEGMRLFAEGRVDAYLGFPPEPQELRARGIGRVVVNSALDRPWSQYFCCIVASNREFARRHPVATKRALRAILKSADVCASEPERVARSVVDRGFSKNYEYTAQAMREVPYDRWRDLNPEDSMRFYALRLHEAGMVGSSPQKLIAEGSDWRFLTELKRELKG